MVSTAFGGTQTNGGLFKGTGASTINVGIQASADGGVTNYGGLFKTNNNFGTTYAIYAQAQPSSNGAGPNWAGWFDGDVNFIGGHVVGSQFGWTSDRNLKTNIDSIENALSIINSMLPKTFFYDTTVHPQMHLPDQRQYGLIAQDVESVLPELVANAIFPAQYDSLGNLTSTSFNYKTLNYNAFIAILMKGMQEQQREIDSLRTQMNTCCSMNSRTQNPNTDQITNQTNVTLTNAESIVLNQNVPNPFAEQTTITYNLPESVQKAQLLFYDATGKLIKSVDLNDRGKGQINVFANDLSNGIYSYALVVDGQLADTKRMVKTQ